MKPFEFPKLVIEKHDGILVVRDDLLDGGSKRRFIDRLIREDDAVEWVFGGCPANGYAQISLPMQTAVYGKTVTLFMAKRRMSNLTEYQKRALKEGARIEWVPDGMLNVTLRRAKEYFLEDPKRRRILPLGLEHVKVMEDTVKWAKTLKLNPTEVWSVGSSGTLSRGLQRAFPEAEMHVVQVGHTMNMREVGRAIRHISPYGFSTPVKQSEAPPFPSAPTYDAKAWRFILEHASKDALFWNVGA